MPRSVRLYDFRPGDVLFFRASTPGQVFIALVTMPWHLWVLAAGASALAAAYGLPAATALCVSISAITAAYIASPKMSHVGIVSRRYGAPVLYESTTGNKRPCLQQCMVVSGVQIQGIAARIREHPGDVYRMRPQIREQRRVAFDALLADDLNTRVGQGYSFFSAALSGTRLLRTVWSPAGRLTAFCSDLVAWALKREGLFPLGIKSNTISPNRLLAVLRRTQRFLPLKRIT